MQLNRLFETVYLLLQKNGRTARELAERFEVSTRTIYRDIDALGAAGIPVYTIQGAGGGIYLDEGFVLNKSLLSADEQQSILVALRSLSAAGSLETERLLGRLGGLFQKADADWIEVDFSRWGDAGADKLKFEQLAAAIKGRAAVEFDYTSSYGKTGRRRALPIKLVYKSRAWYLQAFSPEKDAFRTFKLSRLNGLLTTGERFERAALPAAPPIESTAEAAPRLVRVRLWFSEQVGYRVFDEFDPRAITRDKDGGFLIETALPDDGWIYNYLLSFGAAAKVLGPKPAVERMRRLLGDIEQVYAET